MDLISLLAPRWIYNVIVMQIGQGIPLIVALPLVIASFLEHHLSLSTVRSKLLSPAPAPRLNIELLQMQHLNYYGYYDSFKICVFLIILALLFIVIIKVLFE